MPGFCGGTSHVDNPARAVRASERMTALLIIAHAPLATALRQVAAHVFPDRASVVAALDVTASMTPEQACDQASALLTGGDTLVLTDVFGATPCNVALRLAERQRVRVVTGVNVPMLWRTLCYSDEPLDALVARALAGATQGVMQAHPTRPQQQARPAAQEDANSHRQDQQ
jgi:mannose PTS system EIIA component